MPFPIGLRFSDRSRTPIDSLGSRVVLDADTGSLN
jgi:hypothetical protein